MNGYDESPDLSIETIESILNDRVVGEKAYVQELNDGYAWWKIDAYRDAQGDVLDYMISDEAIRTRDKDSIWTIFSGERSFIYQIFYTLLTDPEKIRPYISMAYLYFLIKGHIRSIFVQNNPLVGFENFQLYQKWKLAAVKQTPIWDHYGQYVLQTTIRPKTKDHIEGRIRLWKSENMSFEESYMKEFAGCNVGIATRKKMCGVNKMTIVYHFIKQSGLSDKDAYTNDVARYATYRRRLQDECENVITLYKKQRKPYHAPFENVPKLTGIDAAGNELYCRPEVFAHVYRCCRKRGIAHQTYHVGEDFLDLIDGLRAVDEAVRFLELDKRCRIGHGLAMGTDALRYYESRHYHSLVPRQNHLDNCVWLYIKGIEWGEKTMTQIMQKWLMNEAASAYVEIGYNEVMPFEIETYWHSMLMRGTDVDFIGNEIQLCSTVWKQTAYQNSKDIRQAMQDEDAVLLYELYHRNKKIKTKGAEVIDIKWRKGTERVVRKVQEQMIQMLADKGIAIESNPTSNYKIGRFDRYDELPLFQFCPIRDKNPRTTICTSINTDDRGVFATSIEREYSLISLALKKHPYGRRRYTEAEIRTYIERVQSNGKKQCFR